MNDDVLRQIAADLNQAPDTAGRTARMAALVTEVNLRVASEALRRIPLDSTPYAYQAWCVVGDQR